MAGSDIDRLPPLPLDQLDQQQRAAAQAIIDGPRGALYGPFVPKSKGKKRTYTKIK